MNFKAGVVCAFGLLLNASLLGLMFCMSGNVAAVSWSIETVDSVGDVGEFSHLAIDSSGYAHISYHDYDNNNVKYAHWTGSAWITSIVGSAGTEGWHGDSTGIVLDASGTPHISYYHSNSLSTGELMYAWWTGSSWSVTTVDSAGCVGIWNSIALDSSGHPHISYYDGLNGDLKYAEWTGSTWSVTTVQSTNDVGLYTSLALDSSDHPRISYLNNTDWTLMYAEWTGTNWDFQTIDGVSGFGGRSSLALDSGDRPRISYYYSASMTTGSLKYAEWLGTSWIITTVDSTGDMGFYNSLALDAGGNPRIAYLDYRNTVLMYAEWDNSAWSSSIADPNPVYEVGMYASLALDAAGNPQISYYNRALGNLLFARGSGGNSPPNKPLVLSGPSWGRVGVSYSYSAMTIDQDGDQINYSFDWGDGDGSDVGPLPSGTVASASHSWSSIGIYNVMVIATDEHGRSSDWSDPIAVSIVSTDSPGPPENVAASAQDRAVSLSWSPPSDNGGYPIVNYTVYRGTEPGWEVTLVKLANVVSYDDAGLTNGQTYYYRITANNTVKEGPMSIEVNATPMTVPSAPILNATAGDRSASLSWSPPSDDGGSPVTRYDVYRDGSLIFSTSSDYYLDTGLTNGVTYSYTVRAVNAVGAGPASNAVTVSPKAATQASILQQPWFWIFILFVILLVVAIIAVAARRASKKRKAAAQPPVYRVQEPYHPVPARVAPRSGSIPPPSVPGPTPTRGYAPPPPPPPEPEPLTPVATQGAFTQARCPHCGSSLATGAAFCVMCGRRIG